jgi:hypothetical protein
MSYLGMTDLSPEGIPVCLVRLPPPWQTYLRIPLPVLGFMVRWPALRCLLAIHFSCMPQAVLLPLRDAAQSWSRFAVPCQKQRKICCCGPTASAGIATTLEEPG